MGKLENTWRSALSRRKAFRSMAAFLAASPLLRGQLDPFRDHSRVPGLDERLRLAGRAENDERVPQDGRCGLHGYFDLERAAGRLHGAELDPYHARHGAQRHELSLRGRHFRSVDAVRDEERDATRRDAGLPGAREHRERFG